MARASMVWFRQDLRLEDNPALQRATKRDAPVIVVYIWAPEEEADWAPGGASRWWLHQSLTDLDRRLRTMGSTLVLRRGPSLSTLRSLARATGADAVFWNRRYEPAIAARDEAIETALRDDGLEVETFNGALLHEPWTIRNKSRKPFQVFTPFWKHCLAQTDPPQPSDAPETLRTPSQWPTSEPLSSFELEPRVPWAEGIRAVWQPGEAGAGRQLQRFLHGAFERYESQRNRPDVPGTSRLSPHLHFGEISPRQIWHALRRRAETLEWPTESWRGSQFLTEIGWREFSHHLLHYFPHTHLRPLRTEFDRFAWQNNPSWLRAWQRGQTGYPLVDAGMRELWTTGFMHNRVRMVTASFLVKDLLIPWQEGARWFWDTLVDADLAQNTLGWQWTAGCGADAAPFFRVFHPNTQGEKFDPAGVYVRHWVPELAKLPNAWVHRPHDAPADVLAKAGVLLGRTYPHPLISHALARDVALQTYAALRR